LHPSKKKKKKGRLKGVVCVPKFSARKKEKKKKNPMSGEDKKEKGGVEGEEKPVAPLGPRAGINAPPRDKPTACIVIGMAGSGKTTLMQVTCRGTAKKKKKKKKNSFAHLRVSEKKKKKKRKKN
jgi:hypothetical protein